MDKRVLIGIAVAGAALLYVLSKRKAATKTEVIVRQNPKPRNYAAGGGGDEDTEEESGEELVEHSEAAELEFHWAPPPPPKVTYQPVVSANSGAYSVPVSQSAPTPVYASSPGYPDWGYGNVVQGNPGAPAPTYPISMAGDRVELPPEPAPSGAGSFNYFAI